jgi:hypothetical protein
MISDTYVINGINGINVVLLMANKYPIMKM